jgi:hypothetical protein
MKAQSRFVRPPRLAAWLLKLFTSLEEDEEIIGDLLEEFGQHASRSGIAFARSWYWRQTVKSLVHLAGAGFRSAPWSTAALVIAGFLLKRFASGLPEQAIAAAVNRTSFYEHHFSAYMFWMTYGIVLGHIVVAGLVGAIIAVAARGREMITTLALASIGCLMTAAALVVWIVRGQDLPLLRLLWPIADSLAVVVGGIIVRSRRSGKTALSVDA